MAIGGGVEHGGLIEIPDPFEKKKTASKMLDTLRAMSHAEAFAWLGAALRSAGRVRAFRDPDGGLLVTLAVYWLGRRFRLGLRIAGYSSSAGIDGASIAGQVEALVAATGNPAAKWSSACPAGRVLHVASGANPSIVLIWIYDEDNPPPGTADPAPVMA